MDGCKGHSLIHKPPRLKKIRTSFLKLKLVQTWFLSCTGQQTVTARRVLQPSWAQFCNRICDFYRTCFSITVALRNSQWSSQSFSLQWAEGCCSHSCDSHFLCNTSIPAKERAYFLTHSFGQKKGTCKDCRYRWIQNRGNPAAICKETRLRG